MLITTKPRSFKSRAEELWFLLKNKIIAFNDLTDEEVDLFMKWFVEQTGIKECRHQCDICIQRQICDNWIRLQAREEGYSYE